MKIGEYHIEVTRTAHVYSLGTAGPHIRRLWIVCHGYGQLASTFIRNFQPLSGPEVLILAPEGLSRFYWGGLSGPVVASWMTSKDRLQEIADYARFLQGLLDDVLPRLHPEVRISLFGFSQGCATQVRWLMEKFPPFHDLVLWAGTVPEDLDYRPCLPYFSSKNLRIAYGTEDPLIKPERLSEQRAFLQEMRLPFVEHSFPGGHRVDAETLAGLLGPMALK